MKRVEYVEIGRAELKVDCYAGETFDQHQPGWEAHMDGDMESEHGMAELTLGANAFRPGTKVIITEPVCPECDCQRELCRHSLDSLYGSTDPRCPPDCKHKASPDAVRMFDEIYSTKGAAAAAEMTLRLSRDLEESKPR